MLTIGNIRHVVYEPHNRLCPMRLDRWQLRVMAGWQTRLAEAAPVTR